MKQLIISLSLMLGLAASAQQVVGTWEIFPNYATPTSVVETPGYVYTLSGTSLCGYDKSTGEVMAFNTSNRLNDSSVSGIWYDPGEKYLFIAYTDYNIDLLFDDGRIINVPDLRDAAISDSKQINQVAFSDGKAYAALNSGMLVIDATHGAVTESCLWGFKLDNIAVTDKKILVFSTEPDKGGKWYVANKNVSHHNFQAAFTLSNRSVYPNAGVITLGPNAVMVGNGTKAYLMTVDNDAADNASAIVGATEISGVNGLIQKDANLQTAKEGAVAAGSGNVFQISADGKLLATHSIAQAAGKRVADWDFSDGKLWIAGTDGYGEYSIDAAGYSVAPVKPNGTSGSNVGIFHQLPDGTIYFSTVGCGQGSIINSASYGKPAYIDRIASGAMAIEPVLQPLTSMAAFHFVPGSENILTVNFNSGLRYWDEDKTPRVLKSGWFVTDAAVSKDGCLWFIQVTSNPDNIILYKSTPDWIKSTSEAPAVSSITLPGILPSNASRMIIDENKGNIIVTGRNGVEVIKMPPTNEALSSSTQMAYGDTSSDEDGMSFGGYIFIPLVIDQGGQIWGGNDTGVYVIRNSDDVFTPGWAPMRPKVARNDGTNLADYLLDQVDVHNIAVDANNHKWISTLGSGLYRVSADGTKILDHFTTENSDIPSDIVFACLPDRNSNRIFVGTDNGLSIYHAMSSPAAPDYSDVYAYPNPVTPDYTGWITIAGLMDGSLVKIADAAGRVFFQGKSNGGSVIWNGCDASGRRVKSGVYFVFASQHQEGGSSNAAVAKIVVVN